MIFFVEGIEDETKTLFRGNEMPHCPPLPSLPPSLSATTDPGALNRAEWIKFAALFFNKEAEANTLFNAISQNFNAISSAAKQQAVVQPKLVAWVMWWPAAEYGPFIDTPGISIHFARYEQQLTAAAGARILDMSGLQQFVSQNLTRQPLYSSPNSVYIYANQTDVLRAMLQTVDVVIDGARYFDVNGVGTSDVDIDMAAFLKVGWKGGPITCGNGCSSLTVIIAQVYGLSTSDIPKLSFLWNNALLREDGVTGPDSYTEWFEMAVVRPDQVRDSTLGC